MFFSEAVIEKIFNAAILMDSTDHLRDGITRA
jgi:hypothetical protein